ncbi:hypothetical protein [Kitasatospora cineracea]|uniref:hypothetical protein n=1 Tax=Kitasatospora cineracea TaxID=88074 RepID=UPI0037F1AE1F
MVQWTDTREGYARLGEEYTPDYRGYVINVSDIGEDWYVYAWNERTGTTDWLTRTDTEAVAREILEVWTGVTRSGYLCEIYVSDEIGHCSDNATMVRFTDSKRRPGKHVRIMECSEHVYRSDSWVRLAIPEYRQRWEIDPADSALIGGRLGPVQDGERTWYIEVDHTCQAPFLRSTLRRALNAAEPVWAGTEYVNAARHLSFNLPDSGPWYLTRTELHTLRQALERRRAGGSWGAGVTASCEALDAMAERITAASEHAIRRAQQS